MGENTQRVYSIWPSWRAKRWPRNSGAPARSSSHLQRPKNAQLVPGHAPYLHHIWFGTKRESQHQEPTLPDILGPNLLKVFTQCLLSSLGRQGRLSCPQRLPGSPSPQSRKRQTFTVGMCKNQELSNLSPVNSSQACISRQGLPSGNTRPPVQGLLLSPEHRL